MEGFQWPTLGRCRNFNIVFGEFIQFLHTGNSHWVCVSSVGCLPGIVNLYDSLYHNIIEEEVEAQVVDLVGEEHLKGIAVVSVQQQPNGDDCGVFASAFATCLVHYQTPETLQFDRSKCVNIYWSVSGRQNDTFPNHLVKTLLTLSLAN